MTGRVELFGVFAGENFWPHYLIALVPIGALSAARDRGDTAPPSATAGKAVRSTLDDAAVDPVVVLTALVIVRRVAAGWGPVVPPHSMSGHRQWHRELVGCRPR